MALFDSHNHLQKFADPAKIIAEMRAAGMTGCVVNGTGEDDWEAVARLADEFPDFVQPAFGLHPWKAEQCSDNWIPLLEDYLDRFPNASIGECGLDGWIDGPSMEEQQLVFQPQLMIARERGLPVTIHALKAWEPLMTAFDCQSPPERFLLHSFGGSAELVQRLAPYGGWFSFSGYFLHPKKARVLEAFKAVPPDRVLLETDAPEMLPPEEFIEHPLSDGRNHPANLQRIADGLAAALGMDTAGLLETTASNHATFFSSPPKAK